MGRKLVSWIWLRDELTVLRRMKRPESLLEPRHLLPFSNDVAEELRLLRKAALEPCPDCGSIPMLCTSRSRKGYYYVRCENDSCKTTVLGTIEDWNGIARGEIDPEWNSIASGKPDPDPKP